MKKIIFRIVFYLLLIVFLVSLYIFLEEIIFFEKIYPGVYLDNFDFGGLTKEKAAELIKGATEEVEKGGVVFSANTPQGQKKKALSLVVVSPSDPDLSYRVVDFKIKENVNRAFQIGREGNFFERGEKIFLTKLERKKIGLEVEIKEQEIKKFLEEQFKELGKNPKKPRLEMKEGEIILVGGEEGLVFDFDAALLNLKENLSNLSNKEIPLSYFRESPVLAREDCEETFEKIKNILLTANFALTSSENKWPLKLEDLVSWTEFDLNEAKEAEIVLNQEKVFSFLKEIAKDLEQEAVEPKFKMENSRVVEFRPPQKGKKIDYNETLSKIKDSILERKKNIEIVLKEAEPETKIGEINSLGIKELVGRGESNFAGSPANRRYNIKIGASKINGILIKPDEEFSLVQAIGEVDETTGFLPELVIKGDRTKPEFGGGLCQLGTTAFRVALNAGLPITERTPHTFRVRYYEPAGMDATIYNPKPDFRFINDTGNYLLLHTRIEGNILIFELYGTSDGRQVEVTKPVIYNISSPPPKKIIYTEELKEGEEKKVESAVPGADTSFERTITFPNGTKREEFWKSHYVPWAETWLVGGKPPEEESTTSTPSL